MQTRIQYNLNFNPKTHLIHVNLTILAPEERLLVRLPTWIAGSYMVREFAKQVVTLEGNCTVQKVDKSTWQLSQKRLAAEPWVLNYTVYAYDLSVRGAYLDGSRCFFNATSVCLAVDGYEQVPHQLHIVQPSEQTLWTVATMLDPIAVDASGFGVYQALDYDELADTPVDMAQTRCFEFEVAGAAHEFVVSGCVTDFDAARLMADTQAICQAQIDFFGTGHPFKKGRYIFMLYVGNRIYGGLEHRDSTALMCDRKSLPALGESERSDDYVTLLGLISHEYFHNWNVKRIKPAAFVPYDLSKENYTTLLWAFEGITAYYDDVFLVRSGLISSERYLGLMAKTLSAVERTAGRHQQSLAAASFDAWIKQYRPDENAPNSHISYYTKGSLAALCLDLLIRDKTQHCLSLDDVMRQLWQDYLAQGDDYQGVGEGDWEAIAAQVTGLNLSDFFELAIRSTADLPVIQSLAEGGVALEWQTANIAADLGVTATPHAMGLLLNHVKTGGAAEAAGLAGGDILVALNGLKVGKTLDETLLGYGAETTLSYHAFRREYLLSGQVTLQASVPHTAVLKVVNENALHAWLKS
ncbi:MAG: peptidase M61 [Neisseriaceae bacterium]|nr:peptidase M61 [Neisseriaceae bacterium]